MHRFVFVIIISNFFSCDLNEFRKAYCHQLFHRIEKDNLFDKSLSSSKQLIIENFIKK